MEKSLQVNSMSDLVSIITPCYNGAKYISETIESVINQTYSNWEMFVIDDGSKDNSSEIIENYVKKDDRIRLIRQENKGCAAARNNGIKNANGRYIALLDADDVWHDNFLDEQIKFMNEKNAICVCSSYERIDQNSNTIGHPTKPKKIITVKDMKVMNCVGCLTGLYDSSKYGKMYLDESLHSVRDDYAFWYEIISLEDKAYGNQKILAKYRVISSSTTGKKIPLIKIQYSFYRNYLKLNPLSSFINLLRWGLSGLRKFS